MKKTTQEKKRMKRKAKKKNANRQITTARKAAKLSNVDVSTAEKRLKEIVGDDIEAFEARLPEGWRDLPYLNLNMPSPTNGFTDKFIEEYWENHTIWLAHSKSYRKLYTEGGKIISPEVLEKIKEIQLEDNLDPETDNGLWWANYF